MEEEELRTHDPGFWEDAKRAEVQMKKVKELKKWIELYNEVHAAAEELQLAYEYVKEGIVSEEEIDEAYSKAIQLVESLEFRNMLRQEADQMAVRKARTGLLCCSVCTHAGRRQMDIRFP